MTVIASSAEVALSDATPWSRSVSETDSRDGPPSSSLAHPLASRTDAIPDSSSSFFIVLSFWWVVRPRRRGTPTTHVSGGTTTRTRGDRATASLLRRLVRGRPPRRCSRSPRLRREAIVARDALHRLRTTKGARDLLSRLGVD